MPESVGRFGLGRGIDGGSGGRPAATADHSRETVALARPPRLTGGVELHTKRVYDAPADDDGYRVLVDRLWPRGLSKQRAAVDLWERRVAPSDDLRRAFHHEGLPWSEFEKQYRAELAAGSDLAAVRAALAPHPIVTLLYGAHDAEHNNAIVLADLLTHS